MDPCVTKMVGCGTSGIVVVIQWLRYTWYWVTVMYEKCSFGYCFRSQFSSTRQEITKSKHK